jgi:hypothetical protein
LWQPPAKLVKKYARLACFAKVEHLKQQSDPDGSFNGKMARNIAPRDPMFNLIWAQYTVPLEKFVYKNFCNRGLFANIIPGDGTPIFAKGANSFERGAAFTRKWKSAEARCGEPVNVVPIDAENYDGTQNEFLIRVEAMFFRLVFTLCNIEMFLVCIIVNRFIDNKGLRGWGFIRQGARASGDMHTALMNSVLQFIYVLTAFIRAGRLHWFLDYYGDGDDGNVFVAARHASVVQEMLAQTFNELGMKLTTSAPFTKWSEVEFCQSSIIRVEKDGQLVPKMVQNPYKMAMTVGSHIHMRKLQDAEEYLSTVFKCYQILNRGVPIYHYLDHLIVTKFGKHKLDTNSSLVRRLFKERDDAPHEASTSLKSSAVAEPCEESRLDFRVFMDLGAQYAAEAEITGQSKTWIRDTWSAPKVLMTIKPLAWQAGAQ